jgi:hypothetical protein
VLKSKVAGIKKISSLFLEVTTSCQARALGIKGCLGLEREECSLASTHSILKKVQEFRKQRSQALLLKYKNRNTKRMRN